ncbi:MAG: arginase [Nitrosopumilaceae archaeon]|nr:arginase family protein [Nitrosopumilaceae archaeon]NIT99924.1 arginase family protein [Nitrosopumilaceae archaeon]NIU86278.1 arginase [Nitrosopumilaceae archaeon]NIV65033.1 arginase [Nitrosopumilaceae archaeon]NIX60527.1 arginase [Nitrosopumilaceae archaeon]
MKKICWANSKTIATSDVIIVGIPDESSSHSSRKGTSEAPDQIRKVSMKQDTYQRNKMKSIGYPASGISKKIFDYGNITKNEVCKVYNKFPHTSVPVTVGGDHSITRDVIESLYEKRGKLSLVYFDAHPDIISSTTNYHGSVFYDVLEYINPKSSLQIGIRTPEREEIDNLKKFNIMTITPLDILQDGILTITKKILKKINDNAYISFDMDCIDPAYAPGVSVPVPFGLSNNDALYLIKSIVESGIIGMDIVEVCPKYDIRDRTSHLTSRLIGETISSL